MFAPLRIQSNLNTHLIVGVYQIGPVAHQSSGQRKFAYVINREIERSRCQLYEPFTPRVEKWIVFDDYAGNSFLNQGARKRCLFPHQYWPRQQVVLVPFQPLQKSEVSRRADYLNTFDIRQQANCAARRKGPVIASRAASP